jgi:hypothetical protein
MANALSGVKYGARITTGAALSLVKIMTLGILSTSLTSGLGIALIIYQTFHGSSGPVHASGHAAMLVLFMARPIGMALMILSLFASPYLFFLFGNQYIVRKVAGRILADKGEVLLYPMLDRAFNAVKQKQPDLLRKGADASMMKIRLLQEAAHGGEDKWTRKVLLFALKKTDLHSLDLSDTHISAGDIVKGKVIAQMQEFTQHDRKIFWLILAIQWISVSLIATGII